MKLKHELPKAPSRTGGCRTCGEVFTGLTGFDLHRVGKYPDRRCLTAGEMIEKGFEQNPKGYWIAPRRGFAARGVSLETTIPDNSCA